MSIDALLMQYGLLAIFLLLFIKSIGVPLPVPADVILLTAAAGVAQGKFILWQSIIALLIALVLGGLIQFWLARGPGRQILLRFGRYLGLTPARLEAASARVKKGGIVGMSITVLIPGVRGVAVVAAGLADLPLLVFLSGLTLGSLCFLSIHFFLGYLGGSLLAKLAHFGSPMLLVAVLLFLIVFGLWYVAFQRQKTAGDERRAAALETWHEGICPLCLTLSTVGNRDMLS